MKVLSLILSGALVSAVVSSAYSASPRNPVARVVGGEIRGRLIVGGGASFKGVPYAQPPVGKLRWRDPQPVKPWPGIREAATFGHSCTQESFSFNRVEAQGSQEDCLYLNVWTPQWPAQSPKAVMVWLYGGGNAAGGTSVAYMNGAALSRRGVIVVTVNYRLGIFGFFAHPGLSSESPHHSSGNYGLLDQIAALKWVQENIARFGGDPNRVTLFGQSAGAIDTSILVASPLAKGLITRSIQESGPPIRPIVTLASAERDGVRFAEALRAPSGSSAAVKFLRSIPGPILEKEAVHMIGWAGNPLESPNIDSYLIPRYPAVTYEEGREMPIPMIVGGNAREEPRNYTRQDMVKVIKENFGRVAPQAMHYYGLNKTTMGNYDSLYGPTSTQINADTRHRCGAEVESIWRSSHGRPTYQYQFDWPVAAEKATRHQAEIPYVFGNLLTSGFLGGHYTAAERRVSYQIQTYWTNFAKTGDPNLPATKGLPNWPQSNPKQRPYLEFTVHHGPVVRDALRHKVCDLYIKALKETIPADTAADK